MKRCQARQRRRLAATSGRSCSAALSDFFMPQADPAERVVDRREPGDDTGPALELRLQLGERDVRARLDQSAQIALMRREQRSPMAAKARRRSTPCRAHPLHQLDRRRRADGKPSRGFADRAATLDRPHDPLAQVQRHRCRHDPHPARLNHHGRITGADSMQ
jgi:hypothetical protein